MIVYGQAYDPATAPFPEAVEATEPAPIPAPPYRRPRIRTTTARRPNTRTNTPALVALAAALLGLLK